MIRLAVRGIRKHFGPDPVLDGVSFDLRAGERAALVGPNGTGKTTLLKILAEREEADAGSVDWAAGTSVGFLEQHPQFAEDRTLWAEAREALRELIDMAEQAETIAHQLSETDDPSQHRRLGQRFDYLQQELHRRDGYHLDHKIERVLTGLGFASPSFRQPVSQLSGGQQNRLLLARLLLEQPDVLLLDEPSNHLDLEATQWLEDFLMASQQTLILVSHDRYFLDRVTTRTLELFRGTVDSYSGNYSAYQRQKAERLGSSAAHLPAPAGRDRQDGGFHPPEPIRPEARPSRGSTKEAGADRARRSASGDRRAADAVRSSQPDGRHRDAG
jgi:ATP-binding cassette, subfamily F, member 3